MLNRIIKWEEHGISIEADAKHVKAMIEETGLKDAKAVMTPGVRDSLGGLRKEIDLLLEMSEDRVSPKGLELLEKVLNEAEVEESLKKSLPGSADNSLHRAVGTDGRRIEDASGQSQDLDSEELNAEEHSQYRSITMKADYLAMDRPDIQWATRECAKMISSPTQGSMVKLKRLIKYLIGVPRMKVLLSWYNKTGKINVLSDSDWAGSKADRRSVSGGCIMLGGNWIRSWSKDQAVIARSSAEAELYAANLAGTQSLGLKTMMKEIGWDAEVCLHVDAAATIGVLHRRGLGKIRHLEVEALWMQQVIYEKKLKLVKVRGEDNFADIGTKPLKRDAIEEFMFWMGFATA